jgi:hypothetical protein
MTWLAGLFLLAHGLVHVGSWCTPLAPDKAPFRPTPFLACCPRWMGGRARALAVVLGIAAAAVFLVTGTGVIMGAAWAQAAAITGATVSLLLTLVYFHRWLAFNILINAAIIFVARL